jgi:nucleotide-binding universal stress UspA family protein
MNVLLGVDASEFGYRALDETVERAASAGDDLTVGLYGDRDELADLEEAVRARLAEHGLRAEVLEIDGSPGAALVELADGGPYDRLVIGGGVRSPMGKIQLGSVAEFVLTNATTTVTLVR